MRRNILPIVVISPKQREAQGGEISWLLMKDNEDMNLNH